MSSSDALKWLNENFNFVDSVTLNLDQLQMPTNNQFVLSPSITTADGDVAMP